jgi:hypothetical protein
MLFRKKKLDSIEVGQTFALAAVTLSSQGGSRDTLIGKLQELKESGYKITGLGFRPTLIGVPECRLLDNYISRLHLTELGGFEVRGVRGNGFYLEESFRLATEEVVRDYQRENPDIAEKVAEIVGLNFGQILQPAGLKYNS